MIARIDIRLILIASLIAVLISIFVFPFLQTLLDSFTDIELDRPVSAYLLWGYFPLLLSGFYVGFFAKSSVIVNGVLVGLLYSFILDLLYIIFFRDMADFSLMSKIYGPVRDGILCSLIAWVTFKISQVLKKKKGEQNF